MNMLTYINFFLIVCEYVELSSVLFLLIVLVANSGSLQNILFLTSLEQKM